jgi:hypothetical protein
LISVVEIIKREYVNSGAGIGLWQYNRSENATPITRAKRRGGQAAQVDADGDEVLLTEILKNKGT